MSAARWSAGKVAVPGVGERRRRTNPKMVAPSGVSNDRKCSSPSLAAYTRSVSVARAALLAAVRPAQTQALYFVARGDGSSEFSATLEAHNRAVDKYQRSP